MPEGGEGGGVHGLSLGGFLGFEECGVGSGSVQGLCGRSVRGVVEWVGGPNGLLERAPSSQPTTNNQSTLDEQVLEAGRGELLQNIQENDRNRRVTGKRPY